MKNKILKKFNFASKIIILILILVALIFVIPYLWMVFSSLKTTEEIFKYSWPLTWKTLFPPNPTLINYLNIFGKWKFGKNIINSLIAALGQMVGTLIISTLAAYVFSRMKFKGRDLLFSLVMLTAMVPFEVIMVPLYITIRNLNLTSSYFALFLPWIASPFGVFLMRQSFSEIPRDYDDAAKVEGASLIQVFWHVILPNAKASVITLALMSFMWSWNSFLWPLIVMQDKNKQVAQVAIATFALPGDIPAWGEIFAGATAATIPILIIFILLQRYYIRGVVMSGIKG